MNIRTALLPALVLILAPRALPGQASPGPYRTSYMEATLPAGFSAPVQAETETNGIRMITHASRGKRGGIAIVEIPLNAAILMDTTLQARREALQQVRTGMMSATRATPVGEPTEILTDDRVGLRTRVRGDGSEGHAVLDAFVPRRGALVVIIATFVADEGQKGAEQSPEVKRFLDSIRFRAEVLAAAPVHPDSAGLVRWIAGRWAWTQGDEASNPFTLSWSQDRKSLDLVYSRAVPLDSAGNTRRTFTYRDASVGPGYVRGTIDDERRTDAGGRPVAWDFVWLSEDSFCWRRSDWPPANCTAPIVRVPEPAPPVAPSTR
jgi:hypothetical protein